MRSTKVVFSIVTLSVAVFSSVVDAHPVEEGVSLKGAHYDGHVGEVSPGGVPMEPLSNIRCEDGFAGIFPCKKVDLMSFTPLPMLEATQVSDVWGWEDPETGMQLAIVSSYEGTAFIDVTDGFNPRYLGTLQSEVPGVFGNIWGDIRVYQNVAYIGSEAVDFETFDGYGMQIVDLTQFRGVTQPIEVAQAGQIDDFLNSHNISLNTTSGRLYVAGAMGGLSVCTVEPPHGAHEIVNGNGGAIIYDVATNPLSPTPIGCLNEDGYTHDLQCVTYHGPDADYQGHEICFASNEDHLTIFDATDPASPTILARVKAYDIPYFEEGADFPNYYHHQGWISEDHRLFYLGDELDELGGGNENRTTFIWDMRNLDAPRLIGGHEQRDNAIDHNMFVQDGLLYQSNYSDGLSIFSTHNARHGKLLLRGHFDVFPADDRREFYGTWGNYPFFGDGKVVVTSMDEGVFVLHSRVKAPPQHCGG